VPSPVFSSSSNSSTDIGFPSPALAVFAFSVPTLSPFSVPSPVFSVFAFFCPASFALALPCLFWLSLLFPSLLSLANSSRASFMVSLLYPPSAIFLINILSLELLIDISLLDLPAIINLHAKLHLLIIEPVSNILLFNS